MNLEQARAIGRHAYCYLASGAVLRFDPDDDVVRQLGYPAEPSAWRAAHYFLGEVPQEGWRHLLGCTCGSCHEEAAAETETQSPSPSALHG